MADAGKQQEGMCRMCVSHINSRLAGSVCTGGRCSPSRNSAAPVFHDPASGKWVGGWWVGWGWGGGWVGGWMEFCGWVGVLWVGGRHTAHATQQPTPWRRCLMEQPPPCVAPRTDALGVVPDSATIGVGGGQGLGLVCDGSRLGVVGPRNQFHKLRHLTCTACAAESEGESGAACTAH